MRHPKHSMANQTKNSMKKAFWKSNLSAVSRDSSSSSISSMQWRKTSPKRMAMIRFMSHWKCSHSLSVKSQKTTSNFIPKWDKFSLKFSGSFIHRKNNLLTSILTWWRLDKEEKRHFHKKWRNYLLLYPTNKRQYSST